MKRQTYSANNILDRHLKTKHSQFF